MDLFILLLFFLVYKDISVKIGENLICSEVEFVSSTEVKCKVPSYAGTEYAVVITVDTKQSNRNVTLSYHSLLFYHI